MQDFRSQILELEGFDLKKTDNLFKAIDGSRNMELSRFILALGIPQVGRKTAKTLAQHVISLLVTKMDTMSELVESRGLSEQEINPILFEVFTSLTIDDLIHIRDIGPVSAEAIVDYFTDNAELVKSLLEQVKPKISLVRSGGALEGKSFCVTGSFESMSRDEIHAKIESHGGEVRSAISPKLTYLIVGSDAGSKLQKAQEMGVETVTLESFLQML